MIAKGNTHNNGAKLARYMTRGKEGERAELWQLAGFAANDIRDAFRSVHVMAEATRCEQPFMHVQIRNPEGEQLTRDQWRRVADRIESKLGLTDQPRAIAFHIDEKTGHEHMHVAWSRIDSETLTARPLPFFKERLKEVSRELENTLDITRVRNERDDRVRAPGRKEFEQARRLGVDIHQVRETIRDCYRNSDCGLSFEAALANENLLLARGDRRDFVVIDHAGGMHAVGKRILDVSVAAIRAHLSDLDGERLLTVEQAQERARTLEGSRERKEPVWDHDLEERKWQEALANAAIEKERIERRFVEPGRAGGPDELFDIERQAFRDLSGVGLLQRKVVPPTPEHLSSIERRIWEDYHRSGDARAFVTALADHQIALALVTKEEADRLHREAEFVKAVGNFAPRYREGEIVAVTEPGPFFRRDGQPMEPRRIYRLHERTTGEDRTKVEQFLKPIRKGLQGLDATKAALSARAEDRAAYWEKIRVDNATRISIRAPECGGRGNALGTIRKGTGRAVGKTLDVVGNAFEALLAPILTPEQKRDGERATGERAARAEEKIDLSRYLDDRALERQQREKEHETARQRQRDERER